MAQPESITINGTTYAFSDLSEAARTQLANVQAVDAEIARLQVQMGIARTARNAFVGALEAALQAPAAAQPAAEPQASAS